MTYIAEIESQIAGIPCVIGVTYYKHVEGQGSMYSAASDLDYYGYTDIDWEVCDRRGRPAPWLKRKLTKADNERIENEIIEHQQETYHD